MRGDGLSTSIELLTASAGDTLTAAFVESSVTKGVRIDSHSQLQFFLDYTPHASNTTNATYAEVEVLYTEQAADFADESGGSGSFTWKSYTVEETTVEEDPTTGAGAVSVSEFRVKKWRVRANDTTKKDRSPTFSIFLGCKRVKLNLIEVGASPNFGTLKASVGHQDV